MLRLTPGSLPDLSVYPLTKLSGADMTARVDPTTPDTLKMPLLSPEAYAQAQTFNLCPHWQRLNHKGFCVDRWWVGPPMSWFSAAVVTTVGMGLLGWILVAAGKVKTLQPAVRKVRKVVRAPRWDEL